ncbi:hypothetical protein H4Q26_006749 [Puccinia striiformis f. sp. tritici PST-130]|uniref:Uncharacterized protein n=1 Tax=Puccinia striiformis f. sp. tritici PST-78 TaxID=1165861 RepID=A0A0L0W186_9BASI|nr:hypothetical protein H4Q26_006749 [Puccinia striiformis f. sp. tritici PST-130]KNF05281.1 hypothetical protein PSTG_01496 [Puccinia striiformis f. sp. tritici PST-78]
MAGRRMITRDITIPGMGILPLIASTDRWTRCPLNDWPEPVAGGGVLLMSCPGRPNESIAGSAAAGPPDIFMNFSIDLQPSTTTKLFGVFITELNMNGSQ